jgi:hypothetical protein
VLGVSGYAGIGYYGDATQADTDTFSPALYDGSQSYYEVPKGTWTGTGGTVLTITEQGVPEPGTWALVLGGTALVGGALRSARRRPAMVAA